MIDEEDDDDLYDDEAWDPDDLYLWNDGEDRPVSLSWAEMQAERILQRRGSELDAAARQRVFQEIVARFLEHSLADGEDPLARRLPGESRLLLPPKQNDIPF